MKSINKEILRLALPSILANITVPLVGMVDIAVAGHLDSSAAALIGGISIGSLIFDLLYWNFEFLRAGTGGMTSQAFGRKDWKECSSNLTRGVGFALMIAIAILLLQWPVQKLVFLCVNCSEEVKALALSYFFIRIWAAPATLCLMSIKGWFIGMQDAASSMFTDLIVNGVNIVVSLALALGVPGTGFHGIGFIGIAWGTVAAQYSGLFFAFVMIAVKYRKALGHSLTAEETKAAFKGNSLRQFFSVNGDLFVRSFCLIIIYLAFTSISARFGDVLLAACSVMMKLLMVFSYFTDGFAFAGEALVGKFYGMRSVPQVRSAVKWTFIWSMGIGMFFVGIYYFAGAPLFNLMTSDNIVVNAAMAFIPWLAVMPLVGCPAFTWDGIYTGATATKEMRNAAIGCLLTFCAVWFLGEWTLKPQADSAVHLLFAAYFSHLVYRSIYQTVKYKRVILGSI